MKMPRKEIDVWFTLIEPRQYQRASQSFPSLSCTAKTNERERERERGEMQVYRKWGGRCCKWGYGDSFKEWRNVNGSIEERIESVRSSNIVYPEAFISLVRQRFLTVPLFTSTVTA
ncbi:hypothetical protein AMTRI_Chr10g230810 [Amborella trichopoda]